MATRDDVTDDVFGSLQLPAELLRQFPGMVRGAYDTGMGAVDDVSRLFSGAVHPHSPLGKISAEADDLRHLAPFLQHEMDQPLPLKMAEYGFNFGNNLGRRMIEAPENEQMSSAPAQGGSPIPPPPSAAGNADVMENEFQNYQADPNAFIKSRAGDPSMAPETRQHFRAIEDQQPHLRFAWGGGAPVDVTPGEDLSAEKFGAAPSDYQHGKGGYVIPTEPAYVGDEEVDDEARRAKIRSLQDPYATQRMKTASDIAVAQAKETAHAAGTRAIEKERGSDYASGRDSINARADAARSVVEKASHVPEEKRAQALKEIETQRADDLQALREESSIATRMRMGQ